VKNVLILTILALAFLFGCAKKGKATLEIKVASISTGDDLNGGVYLKAIEFDGDGNEIQVIYIDILGEKVAEIPFGTWDLYLIGYVGPNDFSGDKYCGSVLSQVLNQPEMDIAVDLNSSNCSSEPYASMASDKQETATWDSAVWDTSRWE
jgi:hypothetical protein